MNISLDRSPEVQKAFVDHLSKLSKKYPEVTNWLSENSVETLRSEGIEIERANELNTPHFVMKNTHPRDWVKEEFTFYFGESDYAPAGLLIPPEEKPSDIKHSNVIKSSLAVMAVLYAQKRGFRNYMVSVKSEATLVETPHVHLFVYEPKRK